MIIRCVNRRACIRAFPRCRAIAGPQWTCFTGNHRRFLQSATGTSHHDKQRPFAVKTHEYDVFKRLKYPDHDRRDDPSAWTALLEAGLPPRMRQHPDLQLDTEIDITHIGEILLAAQRGFDESLIDKEGVDVLCHLGVTQNRWSAVVWIVKRLVEAFGGKELHETLQPQAIFPWSTEQSLSQLTTHEIDISEDIVLSKSPAVSTLGEITQNGEKNFQTRTTFRRDCLGQIWRSLGQMTMVCADEGMKPEILEIIAYLHHMEVMPMSIYNQRPTPDSTEIQQPPTLRLFSSRILTSLSDAAWRAHEKEVVEEARTKGGEYASMRPEIPGLAYRVRVAGLRPEVWMELILWSCLQGGWVIEGMKILRLLHMQRPEQQWSCLSWRSLGSQESDDVWDRFDYAFKTKTRTEITESGAKSITQIQRTISSEVVNAYIDAVLSVMRPNQEHKGVPPAQVLRHLRIMKKLLDRSGLSLSTGSWDAILVRFFDQQPYVTDSRLHFEGLIGLSPVMGAELASGNGRNLPDYVMDGSAAVLGLFHRALLSRIAAGDVEGAFRLFRALQERADSNKHQSIVDFLSKQQLSHNEPSHSPDDIFSGYFSGIDYPAFNLQIPATTLGSFLDLVTDAKAYDFGSWLLHNHDLDGPVIPEHLYGDPALAPVLIRFAAETGDKKLLSKLISNHSDLAKRDGSAVPEDVLQSFLDSQVNLRRWDAATRILQHIDMRYAYWNPVNLAHVARVMLSEYRDPSSNIPGSNFERAKDLLREMISGKYQRSRGVYNEHISMLVTMVASLDRHWADFCLDFDFIGRFYNINLPTKAFNLVLEGVVHAYGSATARRILSLFWPHSARYAQRVDRPSFDEGLEVPEFTYQPSGTDSPMRKRNVIRIRGDHEQKVVIYGGLRPDLMTIRIIFRKAMEELRHGDSIQEQPGFAASEMDLAQQPNDRDGPDLTESGMIVWAIQCLRMLRMADEDILGELQASLEEHEMRYIRAKIPDLFERADEVRADDVAAGEG